MTIIILFLIGFTLGLLYAFVGERLPLLIPDVKNDIPNSWILNLFIGVINAVILLISYYDYGISYEFFMALIVFGLVVIIFMTDFKYMIILDSPLVISGVLTIILKAYYKGFKAMGISILSGIILFLFMLLIAFIGKKIFKRDALGGGDIKLALVIGLILDLRLGLIAIVLSSLIALPYALASMMLVKTREVPYGPFLAGSMGLVFMFIDKFTNLINFF